MKATTPWTHIHTLFPKLGDTRLPSIRPQQHKGHNTIVLKARMQEVFSPNLPKGDQSTALNLREDARSTATKPANDVDTKAWTVCCIPRRTHIKAAGGDIPSRFLSSIPTPGTRGNDTGTASLQQRPSNNSKGRSTSSEFVTPTKSLRRLKHRHRSFRPSFCPLSYRFSSVSHVSCAASLRLRAKATIPPRHNSGLVFLLATSATSLQMSLHRQRLSSTKGAKKNPKSRRWALFRAIKD